jgi:uncharacterized RDD family membrane protein YckC
MEYTVFIKNKEYGPVSEQTLEDWVEEGRVLPSSTVKDTLSGDILNAKDVSFLTEAFVLQAKYFSQNSKKTFIGIGLPNTVKLKPRLKQKESEFEEYTNFIDTPAKYTARIKAAAIDVLFLFLLACVLFVGINYMILKQVGSLNSLLYVFIALFLSLSIMYFAFQISCSKRTLGMRIGRLIMVRKSDKSKFIFLFRAFVYTLTMFAFCLPNFIFVFITGKEFVLQDLITDISVVYYSK